MRCPRDYSRCGKYNTVRHCPGCQLWDQMKQARLARQTEAMTREAARQDAASQDAVCQEDVGVLPGLYMKAGSDKGPERGIVSDIGPERRIALDSGPGCGIAPDNRPGSKIVSDIGLERRIALDSGPGCGIAPDNRPGREIVPDITSGYARTSKKRQAGMMIDIADRVAMERENVLYLYDGSLNGFYSCVYESYYLKEMPADIATAAFVQPTLIPMKEVATDKWKARKVKTAIIEKISDEASDLIETVFLSCLERKELRVLRFLILAFREGSRVLDMLGHPDVAPLMDAEKHLLKEAHLLKGFVRFSDTDGVLTSSITPKNFILPFIANHFCARYAEERFIIYDKTHKAGLFYQNHKRYIARLDAMPFPDADERETRYRELWKKFYHTIAIESRTNPKCRMTHMPKRYWENMTEMAELL